MQGQIQQHWEQMGLGSCVAVAGGTGDVCRVADISKVPNDFYRDDKKEKDQ